MTAHDIEPAAFLVPANLWPNDAHSVRTLLLQWLTEQKSDAVVDLGAETAEPTVSALQLLVATTRRTNAPHVVLGATATAALATQAKPRCIKVDG